MNEKEMLIVKVLLAEVLLAMFFILGIMTARLLT